MLHFQNPSNGDELQPGTPRLIDELDCSACSTPYVSAPSSPGRGSPSASANSGGYFFSAPASPVHYMLMTSATSAARPLTEQQCEASLLEFEFEFSSSRFSGTGGAVAVGSMSSADELFFNGQIRPMKLSSHLQRPQILAPLMDTEGEDYDDDDGESMKRGRDLKLRSRSLHRKARSLSPLRSAGFQWPEENRGADNHEETTPETAEAAPGNETTPSFSASSSGSSSSGRNSKKWIFLKDLLYRSKSEGRNNGKEKFWASMAFSPSKEKKLSANTNNAPENEKQKSKQTEEKKKKKRETRQPRKPPPTARPANGVSKRRMTVSAHELHYTANRAQAEEMKKRTFLPYRQGLFGCLGFSSKGYGALNGLARTLSPVSSR